MTRNDPHRLTQSNASGAWHLGSVAWLRWVWPCGRKCVTGGGLWSSQKPKPIPVFFLSTPSVDQVGTELRDAPASACLELRAKV